MFGKSLTTLLVSYNDIVPGTTSRATRIPLAYPKQFNRGLQAQAFGRTRPGNLGGNFHYDPLQSPVNAGLAQW